MARKSSADPDTGHGFGDIIGVILLALALLLFVAQWSFDRYDVAFVHIPPNKPAHNWIGPLGAQMAYGCFLVFGLASYTLPVLLALFGMAYVFEGFAYLRRRWPWA